MIRGTGMSNEIGNFLDEYIWMQSLLNFLPFNMNGDLGNIEQLAQNR